MSAGLPASDGEVGIHIRHEDWLDVVIEMVHSVAINVMCLVKYQ